VFGFEEFILFHGLIVFGLWHELPLMFIQNQWLRFRSLGSGQSDGVQFIEIARRAEKEIDDEKRAAAGPSGVDGDRS